MNIWLAAAALFVLSSAGLVPVAPAEEPVQWRGGGGWGPGGQYGRRYDPATVESLTGTVTGVERMQPGKAMGPGVHLQLKTDHETVSVHLGPAWYVEHQEMRLAANDRIEVKGSRITFEGKPAIIAAEVHKGDQTMMLRDANGFPLWAGTRRRQRQ